ncbi:hypothetical protein [Hymenobacter lucidus]|uniref:Glycerophosphoryl diester phosphodiesterase membrane domain-containing protein n=1 Tax=Hymenobacter lucidus TaxID=2880930 RepID=A0ABS8AMX5_9BACT|nr:hypothetical protein [Hymenobacter lucidus]MCB2407565.1 hypothetical protein [Hymenobacter lucidus]
MKPTYTHAADFHQERDFGKKISATFECIAAHFRPLGKCLLYFVLPPTMLAGVGMGLMTNTMFNMAAGQATGKSAVATDAVLVSAFSGVGLAMLAGILSFMLLLSTVYGYIRLVLATETTPTPGQVWQEIKSRGGRMLLAFLFVVALYAVLFAVIGGLMAVSTSFALLLFILFPLAFYVMVPLSLYFPVLWLEDGSLGHALRRCFYLIQGKWWSTFGLLMVTAMIQGMIAMMFALPQYAVMFGKMLKIPGLESDALGIIAQCLYALGIMFTYTIPLMAVVFQYFNLVERKEGMGLRSLIDSIGQGPAPVAYNEAYRADDEGEY